MHYESRLQSMIISMRLVLLIFLAQLCCMNAAAATSGADTGATHSMTSSQTPTLTPKGAFALSNRGDSKVWVMGLTYSPDARYLAVVTVDHSTGTQITVWDVAANKVQTTISGFTQDFGVYPNVALTWTPDGKCVTFGQGGGKFPIQFWDSMNGELVKTLEPDVVATSLDFSSDGTRALASPGGSGSSRIRIYDTLTWKFTELDQGALSVQRLLWAPDGQVLAIGYWKVKRPSRFEAGDGRSTPDQGEFKTNDSVARLIDPAGHVADHTKLLIASIAKKIQSNGKDFSYFENQLSDNPFVVGDRMGDTVAVDYGHILNGRSLQMLTYATGAVSGVQAFPIVIDQRNMAISPDGNYLYLNGSYLYPKGDAPLGSSDAANNSIIDTRTGKPVLNFHGGHAGIAIRPDGKQLAIGNANSVELFDIH